MEEPRTVIPKPTPLQKYNSSQPLRSAIRTLEQKQKQLLKETSSFAASPPSKITPLQFENLIPIDTALPETQKKIISKQVDEKWLQQMKEHKPNINEYLFMHKEKPILPSTPSLQELHTKIYSKLVNESIFLDKIQSKSLMDNPFLRTPF